MSLTNIFDISSTAMSSQAIRLNAIASNLSNANSIGKNPEDTYRAKVPIFEPILNKHLPNHHPLKNLGGVKVKEIVDVDTPLKVMYEPNNPLANEKGYVYYSNVNHIQEMTDMISASRSYENNVEVMDAAKKMLRKTLDLGK